MRTAPFQYFQPWTGCTAAFAGRVPPVFTAGGGPPVVILHEINGASPALFAFAHRVALRGFSAFVPVLFGTPNGHPSQIFKIVQTVRVCLGREFSCFNARRSSPDRRSGPGTRFVRLPGGSSEGSERRRDRRRRPMPNRKFRIGDGGRRASAGAGRFRAGAALSNTVETGEPIGARIRRCGGDRAAGTPAARNGDCRVSLRKRSGRSVGANEQTRRGCG